jgi:DNA-binding response OmpR family regulator
MEARDGAEALEMIGNFHFDLVLSDVRMPHVDGETLALHVRSRIPTVPIILMTGVPFELRPTVEYNLTCLSKPLSLDELRAKIQSVLSW